MIKEIYQQLLLAHQLGCITTMNIHSRYGQGKMNELIIKQE